MYTRKLIFILLCSIIYSCSQSPSNAIVKSQKKLDSIIQTLPPNISHLFFISPSSKCLYCDKTLFTLSTKSNVKIITTYEKKYLFKHHDSDTNILLLTENDFQNLFSDHYIDLDKYIRLKNGKIQWIQSITPQYIDTLIKCIK